MNPTSIESLDQAVKIANAGLRVVNQRLLTLVALILNAALFVWPMIDPRWERVAAATLFSIASWCLTRLGKPAD